MKPLKILVVDDKRSAADTMARLLRREGDSVQVAYDGATAIDMMRQTPPDIILTDLVMEPLDGMAVLAAARALRPPIEVILMTAHGAIDIAVDAMRLGARDFLTKPVAFNQVKTRLAPLRGDTQTYIDHSSRPFFSESDAASLFLDALSNAAEVTSNVMIEGELGSGRLHAAQVLHAKSANKPLPFTIRDVARDTTWPTNGTIVLPNIDSLPQDLQAKLVRELTTLPAEVRVIATASPKVVQAVNNGVLLASLYYQLAVVVLHLPPLRDRTKDILPILEHAITSLSKRYRRPRPKLTESMLDQFHQHSWPGNVKELINLAERTVVLGAHNLNLTPTPKPVKSAGVPIFGQDFSLADHLDQIEREILVAALQQAKGDRALVGELLGVARNTLRYKLRKYNLLP